MGFPRLTFPLTADFGSTEYWINDIGPFKYGAAVTEFFCGNDLADNVGDGLLLMRRLEEVLRAFGGHLHPYVQEQPTSRGQFSWLEKTPIEGSVYFASHPVDGDDGVMVERWTISCLRDFLYLELGKAIDKGNAPRQCRLCGKWFLHEQGDKTVYCECIAPGETEKTCREIGARAVFEKKIQEEETWKLYKRAYKKYYARVMKGNMNREEFNAWVEHAAAQRDFTIELLKVAKSEEERAQHLEALREDLNRL
ncbi:MAG: DUF6076 domain-containing protein [Dysosmobacter sp.]|nr:DUF6076 domain-containing protein [Dysosmobacter sp.]